MKQEIPAKPRENKVMQSTHLQTTPSRFRSTATKVVKESPRSELVNGVSPGLKSRPVIKPFSTESSPSSISQQKVRRSLVGLNSKPKSSSNEDVKIVSRFGNRSLSEQFFRPRRNVDSVVCDKNGDESEVKVKELQEKLTVSENLVQNLQDEVLDLRNQLVKLQSLNEELQSQNRVYEEKLSLAKNSARSNHDQIKMEASSTEEFQRPKLDDVQEFTGHKLGTWQGRKDVANDRSSIKLLSSSSLAIHSVRNAADTQPKIQPKLSPAPPPPPPPLPRLPGKAVTPRKASSIVQFYHSLTRQEGKNETPRGINRSYPVPANAHNSIVGEIQNRSSHLLAIKRDVETKGEFVNSLIDKVQTSAYSSIDEVLKFVDWLDGELALLADERAVLKHFNWPERKADAMREAAIEYRDLKRLESDISSYKDEPFMPYETALKKMANLLDKSERSMQRLITLRTSTMVSYKECKIPTDWMLDSGMVTKIKQASMKLARMYMKRVCIELESVRSSERESTQEALVLQGVRFAFRAHQFAGGLDSETMCAFEEIRRRVPAHMGGPRELLSGLAS
ncbi:hypothetical protein MKX01_025421 [Papaver californicum]|nr:hypothetical protein MKX01_025421 [Papaver californicum]